MLKLKAEKYAESFARIVQGSENVTNDQGNRLDAGETAVFARQVEHVYTELFDTLYAPLKFREFFPVDNSVHPGAKTHTYRQYTKVGSAKIISNHADDAPPVNLFGTEYSMKIVPIGDSFDYSLAEIRGAAMANLPLDAMKADAARLMIETRLDSLALLGDADAGIEGMFNHSAVAETAPATGTWSTASATEIIADIQKLWYSIIEDSSDAFKPDTLILPLDVWKYVTLPRTTTSDKTVVTWLLENLDGLMNIDRSVRLNIGGASATENRVVAYQRNPRNMRVVIPQEFEMLPAQERNYSFIINCYARCGGAMVPYPIAMKYQDGV